MAEKGAHLTATTQLKPSIFDVIAQDSLTSTIHPALRKIVEFLASCNPERYGWLLRWFEEVYLIFNSALQYHYLKYHGGSFAEIFYGLQRVSLQGQELKEKGRLLSFICLVIFPYARGKLESLAARLRLDKADGVPPSAGWTETSRIAVIHFHSVFHTVWEGSVLLQYLSYLSGRSPHHSPLLRLVGLILQYVPQDAPPSAWKDLWNNIEHGTSRFSLDLIGTSLLRVLEVGAFFLQFLQWWQAEQTYVNLTALPIPPSPKPLPVEEMYKDKCPICLDVRKIETVLPVSGFVFCYRCIVRHLQENGCCPVTKYPASVNDLIRVYS